MKSRKEPLSLDELVRLVQSTRKYSTLSPSLVREITAEEASKRTKPDDIIKHARSRLHQAAAAYFTGTPQYDTWLKELAEAGSDKTRVREVCLEVMRRHASTNERLEYLSEFYSAIARHIGKVSSVADMACGLNPLAIPWMDLDAGCQYLALDVYSDMASFFESVFPILGVDGRAVVGNLAEPGEEVGSEFDVVFLFKTLPCLEQVRKGSSLRLLRRLRARFMAITYPALSLGGRDKGMEEFYDAQLANLLDELGWSAKRTDFPRETLYIVENPARL
jgi:16S rRNA (guanine(1405)-N(7))-methyltransferase